MKINANVNLTGDLNVEDTSNDSVLTIKDDVNGGTLSIESTANDANNVQAGTINFDPGESTGSEVAVSITAQSSGTTATNRGGKITIKTKSDNGNLLNRLFIDKDSLETENLLTANINATTANINATTVNLQAGGSTKLSTNTNYITATVPVSLPDGSASAPVLTNAGDENTGIYFGATDTVNIATNGIERLNINNSTITAGRNIDMQSIYQLINLPNPTSNQQAATKAYVDTNLASVNTKVDTFSSSGTWTKPTGVQKIVVFIIDGGRGGTSGGKTNTSSPTFPYTGGGGGSGGALAMFELDASALPSTVTVTVGAGGTGGAGQTVASGGAGGNNGSPSYFGALSTSITGYNKQAFTAAYGGTGAGLTSTAGETGSSSGSYTPYGLATMVTITGGAGATNSSASNGNTSSATTRNVGAGGGGGGSVYTTLSTAMNAGTGGAGQIPGGGGGGGGRFLKASNTNTSTQVSGAGGDGARGEVVVISYF
jgi:hypothetical protein